MKFALIVWVIYSNGNPYAWKLGRASAFELRNRLKAEHAHAAWTVRSCSARLVLDG